MSRKRTRLDAQHSIGAMHAHGYVPDIVLMTGTGEGREFGLFKSAWPDVTVLGIEAHTELAVTAGKLFDVTHAAVVEYDDVRQVAFHVRDKFAQRSSLHSRQSGADRTVLVDAITLDTYARDRDLFGKRVWLYMDCEGCELSALRGASQLIDSVDWLQLEVVGRSPARPTWPTSDQLLPFVNRLGYEVVADYRRQDRRGFGDMLFRRKQ